MAYGSSLVVSRVARSLIPAWICSSDAPSLGFAATLLSSERAALALTENLLWVGIENRGWEVMLEEYGGGGGRMPVEA